MGQLQTVGGQLLKVGSSLANSPDCCCDECNEDCALCLTCKPEELEVTFAGFAEGTCGTCSFFNDTFILNAFPVRLCFWDIQIDECNADRIAVQLAINGSTFDYELRATIFVGGARVARFEANLGASQPECTTWSSVGTTNLGGLTAWVCDDDAATCTITSVVP